MAIGHLLATSASVIGCTSVRFRRISTTLGAVRHTCMLPMTTRRHPMSPRTLPRSSPSCTLAEIAEYLHVPVQTLYDLRSQGRGPRGFRVGRRLQFRQSEVEAWLAGLEEEDEPAGVGGDSAVSGRPRTAIGTFGEVHVTRIATGRYRASTRYRDVDGRLRRVTATGSNARSATSLLKGRLVDRRGYGSGGVLALSSPFGDLVELWMVDLDSRPLAANTKANYRDDLRVHVCPFFEHYTSGEITTARVESFLKTEASVSYSRAKHSRNLLNQLFSFALAPRRPVAQPAGGHLSAGQAQDPGQALSLEQIQQIRAAAASVAAGTRPQRSEAG